MLPAFLIGFLWENCMTTYSFDSKSLFKDGKRWFPIMGEIHYSRYPEAYWKEALLKMKEGGIDIVSSYVIWIHHEETEGQFDWQGCRSLRKFVQTVQECDLSMILRIGPWSHAEVRHGGFPDWLLAKCPDARNANDERYFSEVEKWYKAVFAQVDGLLLKNGGPIIGVQIENEYGHCGGLTGEAGEAHMKRLEKMARETGFDVPLYTATGWGGAVTAGLLPVMGGYCEAPWDPRVTEIEPSGNYVFTYERNDHAIGCDFGLGEGITFDMALYPYLTAELGGGLQPTFRRRPVAKPKDIGAMSLAKMGSGCNLLGYYMYHGGQNPEGKKTTLEESRASGAPNDLCVKNYDFSAPLGQYGLANGTYGEIKLYSLFVHDFGELLAETETYLPDDNPVTPENLSGLRTSWRYCGCSQCGKKRGFVFVNNFQRRKQMAAHRNAVLSSAEGSGAGVQFPAVDVADGDFFFLPFNMKIGSGLLRTSLATPLCKLRNEREAYVFYSAAAPAGSCAASRSEAVPAENASGGLYQFEGDAPRGCDIVTLTRSDALHAHKVSAGGKEYIIITDADLFQETCGGKTRLHFQSSKKTVFKSFPALDSVPGGFTAADCGNGFTSYEAEAEPAPVPEVSVKKTGETESMAVYAVSAEPWSGAAEDVFIDISWTGNYARLYEDGKLIDDVLFSGEEYPWSIGLKRYGNRAHSFTLEIDALKKGSELFLEKWPDFGTETALKTVSAVHVRAFSETVIEL